jgi:heterodisulfide reductase subunit A-like polyferredoxin
LGHRERYEPHFEVVLTMAGDNEVMLEMLRGLREDVVVIRDNHLAHIAEDIQSIKTEQTRQQKEIDDLTEFVAQAKAYVRNLTLWVGSLLAATLGLPMAL